MVFSKNPRLQNLWFLGTNPNLEGEFEPIDSGEFGLDRFGLGGLKSPMGII